MGRQSDRQITLFKSVGMAIEDVATAAFAYQQALTAGVGTRLQLDAGAATPPGEPVVRLVAPGSSPQ